MDQSNKSNKTSLINNQKQNIFTPILIYRKCNECNKNRKKFDKTQQICHLCIKAKTIPLSGNKVIDDFIRYTQTNNYEKDRRMEFVPFDNFKDVSFVAEGGFSKIYKAIWINGPITNWSEKKQKYNRRKNMTVALKELNNSKNLNSKELNELKIYYSCKYRTAYINKYYGVTQNPATKNFMIITNYYELGDLTRYITNNFFNITWKDKLSKLFDIITGLKLIHDSHIIHKDYHSGNIFINPSAITGDLGLSKSSLGNDEDNDIYGIVPYVASEVLREQKYTKASDIFSFGMIMWELMTGRRPFRDKNHDAELIIEICDGVRPPIVTNVPEGYIELMHQCYRREESNPTKIAESPDIGPATANNPDAIYRSRSLSAMIKSAESTRSLESQNIRLKFEGKRKFNDSLFKDEINKKIKLPENNELELGIDIDIDIQSNNNDYITEEINFDIDIPAG
ncbi:kinase-like domain-containing protein [Rhizophagus irregularis DAOM 181602=DAOM 197198]|nr:kinase-like domain-containing protein [Rhizophagus irregularis DAOM 181602=DAOM 197198]